MSDFRLKWKSWLKLSGVSIFWAYLSGLFVLPLIWALAGESHWLLILLRYSPPVVWLAGFLSVCILAKFSRARHLLPGAALGFVVILFYYMDLHFPTCPAKTGTELSVLSFNIRAGLGGEEAIGSFLASSKCDIIGLQEARQPLRVNKPDPVPSIASLLPDYEMVRGGIRGELVTFSRYPVVSVVEHSLSDLSTAVEAVVNLSGRKVRFLNVHIMTGDPKGLLKNRGRFLERRLLITAEVRHAQAEALRGLVTTGDLPVVIVGDFNSPPNSRVHEILGEKLEDGFSRAGMGLGFTYKANLPLWRIDYVWSRGLEASKCKVLNSGVSDHRAVRAVLRLE